MRYLLMIFVAASLWAGSAKAQTADTPLVLVFAQNEVALTNGDRAQLERLAATAGYDRIVVVVGHADTAETDARALSTNRANLVRDYLLSRGIANGNITVRHEGADRPARNQNPAYNRRVEIYLGDPSGW